MISHWPDHKMCFAMKYKSNVIFTITNFLCVLPISLYAIFKRIINRQQVINISNLEEMLVNYHFIRWLFPIEVLISKDELKFQKKESRYRRIRGKLFTFINENYSFLLNSPFPEAFFLASQTQYQRNETFCNIKAL